MPAQRGGVEHLALRRLAIEILGAAAADAQRRAVGGGGADAFGDLAKGWIHAGDGTAAAVTADFSNQS